MKNTLIGLGAVVIVVGATYAVVPRTVLKEYFQSGDKPTQQQFNNTIDSEVHLTDDTKAPESKVQNPTNEYQAGDTAVKSAPIYQAKVVTEVKTDFKLDTEQSVTFRWTPVVPKPKEPVTYRLKVWQLMQGQNGTQAMKSNAPIVTKEVTDSSEVTVSGLYTGPCKPPYLCEFVWDVQSISTASTNTETRSTEATTQSASDLTMPAHSGGTSDGTH